MGNTRPSCCRFCRHQIRYGVAGIEASTNAWTANIQNPWAKLDQEKPMKSMLNLILHPECTRPPCRCWSRSWTWMPDLWQAEYAIKEAPKRFRSQGFSAWCEYEDKNECYFVGRCIQKRYESNTDMTRACPRQKKTTGGRPLTLSVHDKVVGFAEVSIVGMASPGDKLRRPWVTPAVAVVDIPWIIVIVTSYLLET